MSEAKEDVFAKMLEFVCSAVYEIEMPDGTIWSVPVKVIAIDRAMRYMGEFGGSLAKSLRMDTIPLFMDDESEISDWAEGNMNWNQVSDFATLVEQPDLPKADYQEGWVNGEKAVRLSNVA